MRFLRSKHLIFALTLLPFEASAQLRLTATGGGANYVGLQAPSAVSSSFTWLLPSVDGAANQCLATNGSGTLGWRTAGGTGYSLDADDGSPTNALYVNSSGYVGIGTTAPEDLLHVNILGGNTFQPSLRLVNRDNTNTGGSATGMLFKVNSAATTNYKGGIAFERTAGNGRGSLHFLNNTINDTSNAALSDAKMTIDSSGNVGIGTPNPGNLINAYSTAQYQGFQLNNAGGTVAQLIGLNANDDNGGMALWYTGSKTVQLSANGNSFLNGGNVGIGTSTPGTALQVSGTSTFKGILETVVSAGTCSTSYNIDPTAGTMINLTLNGACAIGITNLAAGQSFSVKLTQSSTTAPTFNAAYKWTGGTAPTWSTSATKYDVFACSSFDGTTLQCMSMIDVR